MTKSKDKSKTQTNGELTKPKGTSLKRQHKFLSDLRSKQRKKGS